jgi:hypothetical protein
MAPGFAGELALVEKFSTVLLCRHADAVQHRLLALLAILLVGVTEVGPSRAGVAAELVGDDYGNAHFECSWCD